jgi:hypothetical protein
MKNTDRASACQWGSPSSGWRRNPVPACSLVFFFLSAYNPPPPYLPPTLLPWMSHLSVVNNIDFENFSEVAQRSTFIF